MFHRPHIVNPRAVVLPADQTYPLNWDREKYLDFFANVQAIEISIFAIRVPTEMDRPSSDAANSLESLKRSTNQPIFSFSRTLRRNLIVKGLHNGSKLLNLTDSPRFSDTQTQSSANGFSLDFERSAMAVDLLCPYVNINFSNGDFSITNRSSAATIGSLNFESYGAFSLYSDTPLVVGGGTIRVANRYDCLIPSATTVRIGQTLTLTFRGAQQIRDFSSYTSATLGGAKLYPSFNDNGCTIIIPENAKSGPLVFERPRFGDDYDRFTTDFKLVVSS